MREMESRLKIKLGIIRDFVYFLMTFAVRENRGNVSLLQSITLICHIYLSQ